MSRIVEVELRVDPHVFKQVALRKGYKEASENVFTSKLLFRPIRIENEKLKYDNIDVPYVTDLIADYLVEQTGGVRQNVSRDEVIIQC